MKTKHPSLITERHKLVVSFRKQGRTFAEIGTVLGLSSSMAYGIYRTAVFRMKNHPAEFHSLTVRTVLCLEKMGFYSEADVRTAVADGRLSIKKGPRNFGRKSLEEILHWLGLFKR